MKPLPFVTALLLSAGIVGVAQAADKSDMSSDAFMQFDDNHDGAISKPEATKHKLSPTAFDQADANKDGKLSQSEYTQATMGSSSGASGSSSTPSSMGGPSGSGSGR